MSINITRLTEIKDKLDEIRGELEELDSDLEDYANEAQDAFAALFDDDDDPDREEAQAAETLAQSLNRVQGEAYSAAQGADAAVYLLESVLEVLE